jgi:hypothetical protein
MIFETMSSSRHIIIISHGMWGTSNDLAYIESQIRTQIGPDDVVLNSKVNSLVLSYHGVDVCGNRLATAVIDLIASLEAGGNDRPLLISFLGYSLGGLICRYAIGRLEAEGIFLRVRPVNFICVACPHLGIRRSPRACINRFYNFFSHRIGGRSTKQMALEDESDPPLLLNMCRPSSAFIAGLERFECRYLFANIRADNTVPYSTSSLTPQNPYKPGGALEALARGSESAIVREYTLPTLSHDSHLGLLSKSIADFAAANPVDAPACCYQTKECFYSCLVLFARVLLFLIALPFILIFFIFGSIYSCCCALQNPEISQAEIQRLVFYRDCTHAGILMGSGEQKKSLAQFPGGDMNTYQLNEPLADSDKTQPTCWHKGAASSIYTADEKQHELAYMFHNLRSARLAWVNVDCRVPGPHTHGRIVVRRQAFDSVGVPVAARIIQTLAAVNSRDRQKDLPANTKQAEPACETKKTV